MEGFDAARWEAHRRRDDYPESSVDELRAAAESHPDSPDVRAHLSRALYHAAARADLRNDVDAYAFARASLWKMARRHPDEPGCVEPWCLVLYNDHRDAVLDARTEEADRLVGEFRRAANTPAARDVLGNALYNAHWAVSDAPSNPRSRELLHRLRRLAEDHPDEPALAAHFARALFNAHHQSRSFGKPEEIAERYAEIADLTARHRSEPAIVGELAKATYDNLVDALRDNKPEVAVPLYAALRRLDRDNPENDTVRAQFARANVVTAATAPTREEALEHLRLVHRLNPALEFADATETFRTMVTEVAERWGLSEDELRDE